MVLSIGQLARRTGLSVDTIRFYETVGLLEPAWREPSGYRKYGPEAIEQLEFIRRAQKMGFTLREIRQLLVLRREREHACTEVQRQLEAKLAQVKDKLRELQALEQELEQQLELCRERSMQADHGGEQCPVLKQLAVVVGNRRLGGRA